MTLVESILCLRRTLFRVLTRRISESTERPLLQLRVLRAIARGNATSQSEVADALLIDAAAVSRIVDRLRDDGLLVRSEGKDRRSVRLDVTEAAQGELDAFAADLEWLDSMAKQHLSTEELETLVRLMTKLRTGLVDCLESRGK